MSYKVKKEDLLSIIDPFKVNLLNVEPIITKQEIQQAISQARIITESGLDERENAIRKIAFLVCNEEYQYINLDKNIKNNYCENPHELIASLFFKNGEVVLMNVDSLMAKELSFQSSDIIREKYTEDNINYNSFDNLQQDTWSNSDFVLSEINKINSAMSFSSYISKDRVRIIFEKMSVDLLSDNEFLEKAMSLNVFVENYPPNYLLSDNFLNYILKNDDLSLAMADRFRNRYSIEQLMSNEKEKAKISAFIEKTIKNTVLLNKSIVLKLLKRKCNAASDFYSSLNNDLKEDNDIIYHLLDHTERNSYTIIESYIPEKFFKDEKNLMTYFEKYMSKKFDIKKYPHIYEDWINDPQKIIKYANVAPIVYDKRGGAIPEEQGFVNILSVLPVKLRKNIEVMKVFISRKPRLYPQLSEVMRDNKELLLAYVKNVGKDINLEKISLKAYFSMDIQEKTELLKYVPKFSLREDFPKEDLNNIEIIKALFSLKKHFEFDEEIFEKNLYNKRENILELITNDKGNYHLLPLRKKLEHDIAFHYLEREKEENGYGNLYSDTLKKLPKELFFSKNFCIKGLKKYNEIFYYGINKSLFSDKEFLYTYLKMIDAKEINENAIKELPEKIISLLEFYQVEKGNYYSTISSIIKKQILSQKLDLNEKPKNVTKRKI